MLRHFYEPSAQDWCSIAEDVEINLRAPANESSSYENDDH